MKRATLGIVLVVGLFAALTGLLTIGVSAQSTGTNWTGVFYNNTTLSGSPVATAQYPSGIYNNWTANPPSDGNGNPVPGVNADNFSARFTSTQVFSVGGTYTFTVYVDDGIRVKMNNVVVLDQFTQNPTGAYRTFTFQQNISAGQSISFELEYVEYTGSALVSFQWGTSGGSTTPIGPTQTAVPPALGNVITVKGLALRTGPYLGASMIGVVRPENVFPILEKNYDEGLFPWYKIQDNLQRVGWVSGRYLNVTGNLDLVPTTSTIFDQIDNPGDLPVLLDVIGYTRSVMNFRRRPSQRTNLLGQIPWGDPVQVIGRTVQGGQNFWLQVRYKGVVGWIYAPFVKLEGVVDALPIR